MSRLTSNSEIRTYKECKRKWWLSYYRQLRRKPNLEGPRKAMQVGDMYHRTLQFYYTPENFGAGYAAVFEHLETIIEAEIVKSGDYADDIRKNGELCRIMIEGYFDWLEETGADSEFEIIAAEKSVTVPLEGLSKPVLLMGKLDTQVRNRSTGGSAFLETKTVQGFDTMKRMAGLNEQFNMYHLLDVIEKRGTGVKLVEGAIINMARRVKRTASAKPPFYERFTVYRKESELRAFYARTWSTIRDILETEARLNADPNAHLLWAYPNPTDSCTWKCPFIQVCRLLDQDNEQAELKLATEYELHDPYERYDEPQEED